MRALATLAAVTALAGCGPPPCTHCPALEGTYQLSPGQGTLDDQSLCLARFELSPPDLLTLTREGSQVRSPDSPLALRGTLADSGDFGLFGDDLFSPAATHVSVSAHFDAPDRLAGEWSTTEDVYGDTVREDGTRITETATCFQSIHFTGQRLAAP